jgi:hypothetical protein
MACRLDFAGCLYVDAWCRQEPDFAIEDMPDVVQPYARCKAWMEAYTQAAMRLVKRLEKGVKLRPNCTGACFACGCSWSLLTEPIVVYVGWRSCFNMD